MRLEFNDGCCYVDRTVLASSEAARTVQRGECDCRNTFCWGGGKQALVRQ